ncbi:hypothetical protein DFH08DRAFT_1023412 [Mycena albidolilacea]|uniref:Chromo domain-containing protein n=1 Tax=Mycena albidolilacea TaxID=1033008 RepID=A0AAD7EJK7_9AGAR|nr:hypothetical protein DFH08DRAFT_1023412 [Mycena albidolilacea]
MEDAKQLFKCFGPQVRCGYVMYASQVATTRTAQMLYTPTLRFLHSPADPRETTRRYYALHGATVLGDHSARANRLAREGAYAIKNYFLQCDIDLGLNVNSLLEKATFTDEKGMVQKLQPSPIDIEDDQTYEMISLYRQYYFWYTDVIRDYSLKISKPVFKERQQQIKDRLAGFEQHQRVIPTERNLFPRPLRNTSQSDSAPRIDTIISRRQHGAEAFWTVTLCGSPAEVQVEEKTTLWLHNISENALKCSQYLQKYGTGPPSGLQAIQAGPMELQPADCAAATPPVLLSTDSQQTVSLCGVSGDFHGETVNSVPPPRVSRDSLSPFPFGSQDWPPTSALAPPAALASSSSLAQLGPGEHPVSNNSDPPRPSIQEPSDKQPDKSPARRRKRKRHTPIFSDHDSGSDFQLEEPESTQNPNKKNQQELNPSFLHDSDEEGDNLEYEVEDIVDWRNENGTREWRVRWKGFNESYDRWLNAEQLSGAVELLDQYNRKHNIDTMDSPCTSLFASPTSSPASSEDEFHPSPKNPDRRTRARRINRRPSLDAAGWKLEAKALNIELLTALLDTKALAQECEELKIARAILTKSAEFRLAHDSLHTVATRIVDQIERHNDLSTQMFFELPPTASASDAWGSRLATLTLTCIADIGSTIPSMVAGSHIHNLIARGVQAQVCRSLVGIYQWLVHLGPSLAEQLTQIHKTSGLAELTSRFPDLAPMVDHIVSFVREHQKLQQQRVEESAARRKKNTSAGRGSGRGRSRGRPKKRRVGEHPETEILAGGTDDPSPEPSTQKKPLRKVKQPNPFARVPANLWGLLSTAKQNQHITLTPLGAAVFLADEDEVYKTATEELCRLWDEHLILKPMLKVDAYLNPNERLTKSRSEILATLLETGYLLLSL